MAKKGWYGDSARHSLAAKGIKSTVVRRRTFANYARANSLPLRLSEMTPSEASKIAQTNCDGCQEVIREAKKQKRMVVYNWETRDAVALGEKMSPKKSYSKKEARTLRMIGSDVSYPIPDRQFSKLKRQITRYR